jgi:hypothetical protein
MGVESIVRGVGVLAVGVAIGVQVGGSVLRAPEAAAGPKCAGGAHGSVVVTPQQRGTVGRAVELGRSAVTLEFVKVDGGIYGFARGDRAWLDRSSNGGASWERCGADRAVLVTDDPMRAIRACNQEMCTEPF